MMFWTKFLNKGNRRTVLAKKNILAMFILKGVSILCSLAVIPMTIHYVSAYEYGIWITLSSLVSWLSFFDIGLGNGLRNKFIEAIQAGKEKLANIYVSTTYAVITLIVVSVWAAAMIAAYYIDWSKVLNADVSLSRELYYTAVIVITNFSVTFILNINRTLINAVQKPAISSAFDTCSQVLLCGALFFLTRYTHGSLIRLALVMGITTISVLLASNIWTYTRLLRKYRPRLRFVRFKYTKDVMSLGIMFFFLSILSIAFYQTNNLIITQYLGPDEVTVYNIAFRYMQVLPMIFTIIITPFWSAFTEAYANGDTQWMKTTRKRLMQTLLVLGLFGALMVMISPVFYKIWIRNAVVVPFAVTVLVYLYQMIEIWGTMWTNLLSGLGKIRLQVICSTVCCVSYVPVCCYFCSRYGLLGMLWVAIILQLLCTSWFGVIQTNKILNNRATGIWNR